MRLVLFVNKRLGIWLESFGYIVMFLSYFLKGIWWGSDDGV